METATKDTIERSRDAAAIKRADTTAASRSSGGLSDLTTATSPRDDHVISNEETKFTTVTTMD